MNRTVTEDEADLRLDAWLVEHAGARSRTQAREWIERGKVFLNGGEVTFDRAGMRLRTGDQVAVWMDRPGSSRPRSRDVVSHRSSLQVVFEDAVVLVVDKRPGILVEPLPGERSETEVTLQDLVEDHLESEGARPRRSDTIRGPEGPRHDNERAIRGPEGRRHREARRHRDGPRHGAARSPRGALVVHRIDRDTSGLVLFAKDEHAQDVLKRQFERRTAERVYLAVLTGCLQQPEGTWRDMLVWDKARLVQRRARPDDEKHAVRVSGRRAAAREAIATYRVVEQFARAALVEVRLVTGKRNQIRIQAELRGHPLVGERIYTSHAAPRSASTIPFDRQALHATRLAFRHPETGRRVEFRSPLPSDLQRLLDALRRDAEDPKVR